MTYRPVFKLNEFRRPTSHYRIRVGGKSLLYAYIRKNACTSFKNLINNHLHPKFILKRALGRESNGRYHISGNMKYFSIANDANFNIDTYDEVIFVYRDPVSRFISIFRNKFIDNSGALDIKNNFEELTSILFENATFNDFLNYAEHSFSLLDCHLWPQKSHLWDIDYSLPISINELSIRMSHCIGNKNSHKWFGHRINASKSEGKIISDVLNNKKISELRELQKNGYAIHTHNFTTDNLNSFVYDRYEMDYDMINEIEAH